MIDFISQLFEQLGLGGRRAPQPIPVRVPSEKRRNLR